MIRQSQWGNYHYSTPQGASVRPAPNDDEQRCDAVEAALLALRMKRDGWVATGVAEERFPDAPGKVTVLVKDGRKA